MSCEVSNTVNNPVFIQKEFSGAQEFGMAVQASHWGLWKSCWRKTGGSRPRLKQVSKLPLELLQMRTLCLIHWTPLLCRACVFNSAVRNDRCHASAPHEDQLKFSKTVEIFAMRAGTRELESARRECREQQADALSRAQIAVDQAAAKVRTVHAHILPNHTIAQCQGLLCVIWPNVLHIMLNTLE